MHRTEAPAPTPIERIDMRAASAKQVEVGKQAAVVDSTGSAKRAKVGKQPAFVDWTASAKWVKVCQVSNASM